MPARQMSVNCQPITPISIGTRVNASSDYPVTRVTIVPALAPNLSIPAIDADIDRYYTTTTVCSLYHAFWNLPFLLATHQESDVTKKQLR